MKATSECIYARGKHGIKHVRRRIRAAIPCAYPARQTHILRSQGNTDMRDAKEQARAEPTRIDAECGTKSQEIDFSRASLAACFPPRDAFSVACRPRGMPRRSG